MNFRLVTVCIIFLILVPVMVTAAETDADLQSAGALYDKSVDLANAGNYTESLMLSDQALALNVSSLLPVIQANRAGILTVLGRYDEAIIAADASLAVEGNLTTAHSIAWYNKGDALRRLGRIDEAKVAFAHAQDLDPALIPPSGMTTPVATVPTTAKSSLPWSLAAGALFLVFITGGIFSRNR